MSKLVAHDAVACVVKNNFFSLFSNFCLACKSCTDRNVESFITVLIGIFLPIILKRCFGRISA